MNEIVKLEMLMKNKKSVIVTGASGFIGYHLVNALLEQDIFVYAIIRPNSKNKERLYQFSNIKIIELAMQDIVYLVDLIQNHCDCFYHIAWEGERNNFQMQNKNITYTLDALETAIKIGCRRFICSGSQAEYGLQDQLITEEVLPKPNTAYGSAKLSACYLSRFRAMQAGIEWIWTRIFSAYGKYDNPNALIPYLIRYLKKGETPNLTKGLQNWDYVYAADVANALIAVSEQGTNGEIYNIASGDVHPLRYFIEQVRDIVAPQQEIIYGEQVNRVVSLKPAIQKMQRDTNWQPQFKFFDGISDIMKDRNF
ncbi:MAG: UDP-N-acetylglucosamine 4-epimerase [Firmicutes bacterium]|nr:UDP-N-acetylglucosamine 4-epimerase [Bacillota bacterium]